MKQKQEIIKKISYVCFYLGVIVEVLLVLIDKSAYTNPIEGRIFQITFLLFLIKASLTKYTVREWIVIILFCLLGSVSYFSTGRNEIIRLVIFVIACKNIDMKKCLRMVFFLTLAGCLLIITLSVAGIYGAVSLTQDYGRGGVETRYTLGMGHPNALQCMVWALTVLGLYLYVEKMKWFHYLFLLLTNLFFFLLSDSKTSLLVIMFTIFTACLTMEKKRKTLTKLNALFMGVVTVFSIGISVIIAGNAYRIFNYIWEGDRAPVTLFFVRLNEFLNGRIRILTENVNMEGTISTWSLFSKPENHYFFDMGWIRLFYWYGIIPAGLLIAVLLWILIYCYQKKKYMDMVLIASFSLYTVIEAHAISVYLARNYVIFLIGAYWYQALKRERVI